MTEVERQLRERPHQGIQAGCASNKDYPSVSTSAKADLLFKTDPQRIKEKPEASILQPQERPNHKASGTVFIKICITKSFLKGGKAQEILRTTISCNTGMILLSAPFPTLINHCHSFRMDTQNFMVASGMI